MNIGKTGKVILVILTACISTIGFFGFQNVSALKKDRETYYSRLRDGAGKEIEIAQSLNDEKAVDRSVNSLASFIEYRSGVTLSENNKEKLALLETEMLSGKRRALTEDQVTDVLLETVFERLARTTPDEITRAANTLRGYDHPDLAKRFKRGREFVRLRSDMPTDGMTAETLAGHLTAIRNSSGASLSAYRSMASIAISKGVAERVSAFAESMPEKYAGANSDLSPVKTVLIAYSVAADDYLIDSSANLKARMKNIQLAYEKKYQVRHPNSDEFRAYGAGGYIYSSPVDLILDQESVNNLLDKIQEKGKIQ